MDNTTMAELKAHGHGHRPEQSGAVQPSGVYVHPVAKDEQGNLIQLIARGNSKLGNPQADGIMRMGYVFDRALTEKFNKNLIQGDKAQARRRFELDDESETQAALRQSEQDNTDKSAKIKALQAQLDAQNPQVQSGAAKIISDSLTVGVGSSDSVPPSVVTAPVQVSRDGTPGVTAPVQVSRDGTPVDPNQSTQV